jgi:DNA polymerase III subunit delta'
MNDSPTLPSALSPLSLRWGIFGHDWAIHAIDQSLRNQRARHAYLFSGADSIGKTSLALGFAAALNCVGDSPVPCGRCTHCTRILNGTHSDLILGRTDENSGTLKIEEIRRVIGQVALKPFEARFRVALLPDFDHARGQAQDALLKTLEEPPPHAVILLVATQIEAILPTITSRSQQFRMRPVSTAIIEQVLTERYFLDRDHARGLSRLAGGRIGWAIRTATQPDVLEERGTQLDQLEQLLLMPLHARFMHADALSKDKPALIATLELWLTYWRDLLHLCADTRIDIANLDRREAFVDLSRRLTLDEVYAALTATQSLIETLSTTNASPRLALEIALMRYPYL